MDKSYSAYKTIGEVAKILNLKSNKKGELATHVIRFWETPVSYTHLRAHETGRNLVCRLLLEIILVSFVFGFLPIRDFFCLIEKVPNLDNFNFFSCLIFEIIVNKKSSIRFSEICLEKPSCI